MWVRLKKMEIGKKQPLLFRNINIDGKSYEKWLLQNPGVCLWEGCDQEGGHGGGWGCRSVMILYTICFSFVDVLVPLSDIQTQLDGKWLPHPTCFTLAPRVHLSLSSWLLGCSSSPNLPPPPPGHHGKCRHPDGSERANVSPSTAGL